VIVVAVSVDRPPQAVACRAVFVPFEGHKTPQRQALGRNSQLFTALFVYWLASVRLLEIITPIAVLPACLVGLVLVVRPPSARSCGSSAGLLSRQLSCRPPRCWPRFAETWCIRAQLDGL
jgi:hypothetical protein